MHCRVLAPWIKVLLLLYYIIMIGVRFDVKCVSGSFGLPSVMGGLLKE